MSLSKQTLNLITKDNFKENFEKLYLNDLLSIDEIADKLNLCYQTCQNIVKYFNLSRDKSKVKSNSLLKSESKQQLYKDIKNRITRDILYQWYIVEDNYYKDAPKHFNISQWQFDKLCKDYNIVKDRSKSNSRHLINMYNEYGSRDNYCKHISEKQKATLINKYGSIDNFYLVRSEKIRQVKIKNHGAANYYDVDKFRQTCLDKYGVPYTCMRPEAKLKGNNSKPNQELEQLLIKNNIDFEREFSLEDKNFDFKINNILLELNPTFTHNSTIGIYNNKPLAINYHKNKSLLANKYNYRCIHIWDWDDKQKIINSLVQNNVIYARKCELREIKDKNIVNSFLNNYHFQNTCKNQSICLGLYYNSELIQIMTFGKPRYNKNYEYELLRLCSKFNYKIIGGSKKLFKYFLDNYKPKSIISYCDLSKFSGDVYNNLGFKLLTINNPSCHWYNTKLKLHFTDALLRQQGFDRLLGHIFGNFGKGANNEQLMLDHKFVKIYDSGQATYIYK